MYKYIQQEANILFWLLFQELYIFLGIHHAHHQEYIIALAVVGIT
jgi:hypothetical protein